MWIFREPSSAHNALDLWLSLASEEHLQEVRGGGE